MRYILFSILFHIILFNPFHRKINTLGNPNISRRSSVAISYNNKKLPENIDNTKRVKNSKETTPIIEKEEMKNHPKKIENDFKSKIKKQEKKKKILKPKEKRKEIKKPIKNNLEKPKNDSLSKNGNFTTNSDGSYTALSSKGIDFEILHQIDPDYPKQAERIKYSKDVVVTARFLVDLNGFVEKVEITKSHKKFGFDKEVIDSLKKWRFKPIIYNKNIIKVYFTKEFIFKSKI